MMTAESLQQQYQSTWSTLSSRQQAAFRGNVTWLLGKSTDPAERTQLEALRNAIQPEGHTVRKPVVAAVATAICVQQGVNLFTTQLQLRRMPLVLADAPVLGQNIGQPESAAAIASRLIGDQPQEHLLLLILDVRNTVVGVHTVHIGTTSQCVVHVGDILRVALLANASSVILAHNHPSGQPEPSDADIKVTREVVAAGQLVGVQVLDHLVVTDVPTKFTSLAQRDSALFSRKYTWH
jgi:DNA repair protein RadC